MKSTRLTNIVLSKKVHVLVFYTLYDVHTTTISPNDAFLRTYPRR